MKAFSQVTSAEFAAMAWQSGKILKVDGTNGSNTKGARGTPRAFLSITAAKAAALSGDMIDVAPGLYPELDILKDGVSMNFRPGAIVNPSVADATVNRAIFDDHGLAVTANIFGAGQFLLTSIALDAPTTSAKSVTSLSRTGGTAICTCTAHGFSTGDAVQITGASPSSYNVIAGLIQVTNANVFTMPAAPGTDSATGTIVATKTDYSSKVTAAVFLRNASSLLTLKARSVIGYLDCDAALLSLVNGQGFHLDTDELLVLPHPTSVVNAGQGEYPKGVFAAGCPFWIKSRRISVAGSGPGYVVRCYDWIGTRKSFFVEADTIVGGAPAFATESDLGTTSDNYVLFVKARESETTGLSNGEAIAEARGGGRVMIDCSRYYAYDSVIKIGQNPISTSNAGAVFARGMTYEGKSTSTELFNNASTGTGRLEVFGGKAIQVNGKGLIHSGGTSKLSGVTINTSATNTATNRPVETSAAGVQLDGCNLIAPAAAAEGIYAASGQTVKIYGTTVTNKAKHANITVQVGTLVTDANVT